jgi:hypothetical protein
MGSRAQIGGASRSIWDRARRAELYSQSKASRLWVDQILAFDALSVRPQIEVRARSADWMWCVVDDVVNEPPERAAAAKIGGPTSDKN